MSTATIQKWGNSHGIRIPKNLLNNLNWNDGEKIILTAKKNRLIIEQAPKQKTIEKLFDGFDSKNYKPQEFDWAEPVGREIW